MNHKLHNTILAFAVVGSALLFGLLAANPIQDEQHAPNAPAERPSFHPAPAVGTAIADDIRFDTAKAIESRARAFEADMARAGSASEMLSLTSAFIAATVVEATLVSVLDEVSHGNHSAGRTRGAAHLQQEDAAQHAPRPARSRGSLAMPYFSTAQGLRRGSGG